jgi:signal transduction histidine kinase
MPSGTHTVLRGGDVHAPFAGPGEIRALCRRLDWAASPLGAVEGWSAALRTAVDVCLGSAFASFVWWGPNLVQLYNDAALAIFRSRHPRTFAVPAREAWADRWERLSPLVHDALTTGASVRMQDVLLPVSHESGREGGYFSFSCGPVHDANGATSGLFVTAFETTRRIHSERQLREVIERAGLSADEAAIERLRALAERDALRHKLLLAEEEERRRLSRELHDEAGQHLTALGLGLQALSDVAVPGSEADRRATQLRELTSTLGRELHAIAVRLRPKSLDDFGLEAALSTYAEEWSRQSGIAIDIHAQPAAQRLPSPIESAIYRAVQEALTNVARHSGARHASIVVERRDGQVVAVVEDDGHGFDPDDVARATGALALGLLGVRERAALLGGTVAHESSRSGTSLYVRIPIGDNSHGARA